MKKTFLILFLSLFLIGLGLQTQFTSYGLLGGVTIAESIKEAEEITKKMPQGIIDEDISEKLISYSEELELRNIFSNAFRQIKKALLNLVFGIAESVEESFYHVINYLDLLSSSQAYSRLERNLQPLIIGLLTIGLTITGFYMIWRKPNAEQKDVFINVFLIIGLFLILPTLTNLLVSATQNAVKNIPTFFYEESLTEVGDDVNSDNTITISESLYQASFYDMKKASDSDFPLPMDKITLQTTKPGTYLKAMSINEVLDSKEGSSVLSYELGGSGLIEIQEPGFITRQTRLDAYSPAYYRWHIEFLFPFLSMLVLVLVYLFAALRTARLILDIAVNRIFVLLASPLYVSNIQKVKEIFNQIVLGYLQIFGIAFTVAMYGLLIALINQTSMSLVLKTIFFLGAGYGAIDGAKFFENIFQVDVGVRSDQAMLGALTRPIRQTGRFATSPVRGVQNLRRASENRTRRLQDKAFRTHNTGKASKSEQRKLYKDIAKGSAAFPGGYSSEDKADIPKTSSHQASTNALHRDIEQGNPAKQTDEKNSGAKSTLSPEAGVFNEKSSDKKAPDIKDHNLEKTKEDPYDYSDRFNYSARDFEKSLEHPYDKTRFSNLSKSEGRASKGRVKGSNKQNEVKNKISKTNNNDLHSTKNNLEKNKKKTKKASKSIKSIKSTGEDIVSKTTRDSLGKDE